MQWYSNGLGVETVARVTRVTGWIDVLATDANKVLIVELEVGAVEVAELPTVVD